MKVLIVKMSSMGDVLHTLPALTDAQLAIPNIEFDWLVEEAFAEIPSWHENVHNVIPIAWRRWRKSIFTLFLNPEWQQFRTSLKEKQYDYIIDAQGLIKSALITRMAHGIRCGFARNSAREGLASLAYQKTFTINTSQHAIMRTRQLFAAALNYSFTPQTIDYGIKQDIATTSLPLPTNYSVFIANTSQTNKRWPIVKWRELISKMLVAKQNIIMPSGYAHEREYIKKIAAGFENVTILPKSSLQQMRTIIAASQSIVSVDTGLAHLAAALDKPTITLYGPTNIQLIGTTGKHQIHLLANGHHVNIPPEQVWQHLKPLLYLHHH